MGFLVFEFSYNVDSNVNFKKPIWQQRLQQRNDREECAARKEYEQLREPFLRNMIELGYIYIALYILEFQIYIYCTIQILLLNYMYLKLRWHNFSNDSKIEVQIEIFCKL